MAMVSGGGSFRPPFPATGFSQVVAAEQARPGQAGRLYSILCVRVCVCVCDILSNIASLVGGHFSSFNSSIGLVNCLGTHVSVPCKTTFCTEIGEVSRQMT